MRLRKRVEPPCLKARRMVLRLMPGRMVCIFSCRSPMSPAIDKVSYNLKFSLDIIACLVTLGQKYNTLQ